MIIPEWSRAWISFSGTKLAALILASFAGLVLYPQTASACSCGPPPSKEAQEKALAGPVDPWVKKWWLEEFEGAVLIGKVIKIEKVDGQWFKEKHRMKKVTIKVERAWLGVTGETFVIYTNLGKGGDCGVPYSKGQTYFFFAQVVGGLPWTSICSPTHPDSFLAKMFEKMFGDGRSFLIA